MTSGSDRSAPMAHVFERFPTFTQTFCHREVVELGRQGMAPAVFSIRRPLDEPDQEFDVELGRRVVYLPEDGELSALIKRLHAERRIPRAMRHALMDWPSGVDKHRVFAAAWLGPRLRRAGVRHAHVHFAGIAARTAYWLRRYYGIGFSFTGHANDIFREDDGLPVGLGDLAGSARFVATVSEFSAGLLRERFPAAAGRIHRAYNGIDLAGWPARGKAPVDRPPLILAVGRLIEKKGFGDLIEACGRLRDRGRDARCVIVGEGPLDADLGARIARRGLADRVTLAGPRPQSAVRDLLGGASVFALPCVVGRDGGMDNLPTVIIEAMACGVPCVSTRIAGIPEMIRDGESGWLVPPNDPEALAGALAGLLDDPARAAAFGRAGRRLAEERFALPVTTRRLKHLLVAYGRVIPPMAAIRRDRRLLGSWLGRWLRRPPGPPGP